jgi:molybdopterin-biosynthesis enzyme MoeA-like protein
MDKTLQKKFRQETKEYYQKAFWQQMMQYSFNVREFERLEGEVKAGITKIEANDEEVKRIKALPDHHSVINRKQTKDLEDASRTARMTAQAARTAMETLDGQIKKFRFDGDRYKRMADYCEEFEMADKKS